MTRMVGMQAAGAEIAVPPGPVPEAMLIVGVVTAAVASAALAARIAGRVRRGSPVVEPRPHPAAPWSGAEVATIALAFLGLLAAAGTVLGPQAPLRLQLLADVATKVGATLVGIAVLRAAGASWAAVGISGEAWRDDLRLALGALALVLGPLLVLAGLLDRVVPYRHPVVTFLQQGRDPVSVGLVVLAAVVVAPIAEEFFFRRVLQGWLEARLPEADGAAAVGLSAAAFAAAHLGHGLAAVPLFLFGLVLGTICRATGSLVPCVMLHALFNAVGVGLLLVAPASPGTAGG